MIKDALNDAEARMKGAVGSLNDDLTAIRTGRASPALVERLMVEYYGTPTPLQQLAAIAAPEPQMITIKPYDAGILNGIEKAIQTSDLGLNPSNDGKIIRLVLPPLTKERRADLVKMVQKRIEEAKVSVRNVRRDAQDELRDLEKEKLISEDEFHGGRDELQKLTDSYIGQIDEIGKRKEHEISDL